MKKLLSLALALVMCVSLFAGCGKYDIKGADLESYVTLCDIESFSYDELAAHYNAYRVSLGENTKTFYANTGYTISFAVTAEVQNADGTYSTYAAWTHDTDSDYVKNYDVYRHTSHSVFENGLAYKLDDASKSTNTPRLIRLGEAFSFTMPIDADYEDAAVAGKTVKFTINVKEVIPSVYSDSYIAEDLQKFYEKYAESKKVIEMGDSVQIDFTGKIDGKTFNGGTGKDFVFIVGEGGFIEGFEEQLVGHKKGEKFDITVTFPADYREADLAGKEAVFSIKVDDVANDSAIISDNTPFADLWELKEYYRIMHYIDYAIVDYIADNSTQIALPEELVADFEDIYENYVKREVSEAIVAYAENGETYTKAEMKEKLYPNGSDKTYVEEMAKDAAYNYILVHLLMKELELEYTDAKYKRDVAKIAEEYTAYYGDVYTVKDVEKMMGEEVLRLSFIDAMLAETLADRVTGAPEFRELEK